jgi:prophage antirepressor-like protein
LPPSFAVIRAPHIKQPTRAVEQAVKRLEDAEICEVISNHITLPVNSDSAKARKTQKMLCLNETGIYEMVFASRKKETVRFRA